MTPQKHTDSPTGPLANLASVYCTQLDYGLKASEPLLRSAARYQLECARLASERARAWITLPSAVANCRSPAELVALNMSFWQAAAASYQESLQRFWSATGSMANGSPAQERAERKDYDHLEVRSERPAKPQDAAARHAA